MPVDDPSAKQTMRRAVRLARAARGERATVEAALARHAAGLLALVEGPDPGPDRCPVAVYVSLPSEPGTGSLRGALRRRGHPVLLPVLRPDRDLDWVRDDGRTVPDPLRPDGERLGVAAPAECGLLLLPALAVDADGTRLGQGGGSYDRVLARLVARDRRPLLLAIVHDEEVLPPAALPREAHDVDVDGWLTPSGARLRPVAPTA